MNTIFLQIGAERRERRAIRLLRARGSGHKPRHSIERCVVGVVSPIECGVDIDQAADPRRVARTENVHFLPGERTANHNRLVDALCVHHVDDVLRQSREFVAARRWRRSPVASTSQADDAISGGEGRAHIVVLMCCDAKSRQEDQCRTRASPVQHFQFHTRVDGD